MYECIWICIPIYLSRLVLIVYVHVYAVMYARVCVCTCSCGCGLTFVSATAGDGMTVDGPSSILLFFSPSFLILSSYPSILLYSPFLPFVHSSFHPSLSLLPCPCIQPYKGFLCSFHSSLPPSVLPSTHLFIVFIVSSSIHPLLPSIPNISFSLSRFFLSFILSSYQSILFILNYFIHLFFHFLSLLPSLHSSLSHVVHAPFHFRCGSEPRVEEFRESRRSSERCAGGNLRPRVLTWSVGVLSFLITTSIEMVTRACHPWTA